MKVTPCALCWGWAVLGGDVCTVAEDVPHGGVAGRVRVLSWQRLCPGEGGETLDSYHHCTPSSTNESSH